MEKEKGFALNYYEIISPSRFSRVEDSDPEANVNRLVYYLDGYYSLLFPA